MDQNVDVRDAPDLSQFQIRVDGALAGVLKYRSEPDRLVLTHTEVDPAFEGRGLGSTLARSVLDEARSRGVTVEPQCPFVRSWIDRHADYTDLVSARG